MGGQDGMGPGQPATPSKSAKYCILLTSGSSAAARSSQSVLRLIQSPPSRLLLNPGTHG